MSSKFFLAPASDTNFIPLNTCSLFKSSRSPKTPCFHLSDVYYLVWMKVKSMRTISPSSGIGEETGKTGEAGGTKTNLPISLCCLRRNAGTNQNPVSQESLEVEWSVERAAWCLLWAEPLILTWSSELSPSVSLTSLCPSPCKYRGGTERL